MKVIKLGNRHELFLDDMLIEQMENIEFGHTTPEKNEIVLNLNKPWEGLYCAYHSVVQHPKTGQIYLYYRGTSWKRGGHDHTCLAISDDGVHFERINNGRNNIILSNKQACHNFAPFYDANPNCPEDECFKALAFTEHEKGFDPALSAYYSKDGIEWHLYEREPVMKDGGMYDSLNTAFWDPNINKYRCYSRYFHKTEEEKKLGPKKRKQFEADYGLRAIQCTVSDDFLHWSQPVPNTYNGGAEPLYNFYTNSTRPVPGAEHHYVAFPMRFVETRHKISEHQSPGVSDCMMLSSRDGNDWVMRNARPWIYPDMDKENWTQRNYMVSAGIAEIYDHFNLYIMQHYAWDDIRLVRYSVPKMRLGYAYSENGSFVTKPFVLEGERLTFNYNTSAVGTFSVAVLDENKTPVKGYDYEIYGNEAAFSVNLKELKGRTLRLLIKLQDAYVYSIGC